MRRATSPPIDPPATQLLVERDDSSRQDEQGHQLLTLATAAGAYPLKKKTSELVNDDDDDEDDDFNDDNNVELVHLVEEGFHNDAPPPSSRSRLQRKKTTQQNQQRPPAERQLIDIWRHYSILISIVFISIIFITTIVCNNNNSNNENNNISRVFQKALHYITLQLTSDFIINFLAGGISGSVAKTCTAPIERVKLLIQTQDVNPKVVSGEVIPYSGIIDCFTRVMKEQGITSLWRGNVTNIIRYFPTQAFNFAFKDSIKSLFPVVDDKETQFGKFFLVNMLSGGLAGAGSLCFVYPLDFARTRLASDVGEDNQQFNGLWDCLRQTFATGGIRGIYNGIGVSIMGIIPYRGIYFGLFDTLSGINPYESASSNVVRATSKFVCAQTSAICAAYVSYPFDTVRRRLQMQSELTEDECVYDGTVDCFVKIVKDEGPWALFKRVLVPMLYVPWVPPWYLSFILKSLLQ